MFATLTARAMALAPKIAPVAKVVAKTAIQDTVLVVGGALAVDGVAMGVARALNRPRRTKTTYEKSVPLSVPDQHVPLKERAARTVQAAKKAPGAVKRFVVKTTKASAAWVRKAAKATVDAVRKAAAKTGRFLRLTGKLAWLEFKYHLFFIVGSAVAAGAGSILSAGNVTLGLVVLFIDLTTMLVVLGTRRLLAIRERIGAQLFDESLPKMNFDEVDEYLASQQTQTTPVETEPEPETDVASEQVEQAFADINGDHLRRNPGVVGRSMAREYLTDHPERAAEVERALNDAMRRAHVDGPTRIKVMASFGAERVRIVGI